MLTSSAILNSQETKETFTYVLIYDTKHFANNLFNKRVPSQGKL